MRDLEAKKSFSYGTRRLKAGDYFTARSVGEARALIALGQAQQRNNADGASVPAAAAAQKPKAKSPPRRKAPSRKPSAKS